MQSIRRGLIHDFMGPDTYRQDFRVYRAGSAKCRIVGVENLFPPATLGDRNRK